MIVNNIDAELEEFEIAGLTAQEAIAETAARMEVLRTQMHVDSATNGEGNRNILTLALAEGIEGRIVKQSLLAALTENGRGPQRHTGPNGKLSISWSQNFTDVLLGESFRSEAWREQGQCNGVTL
ncbi:hypothetical protein R3P38DRAFT_2777197 [Favolaschia claudopus]|uniref:Uncharacterized protein n=1 Tax=Favolaschia claudopus TaxID=2862362 RepID=A0AAW0BKZ1_9AGAR